MEKTFDSLEQRMIAGMLDTFPPFHPRADLLAEADQRVFYDWMHRLYELLLAQPDLLFSTLHPDDSFRHRFNKSSEKKPKVQTYMRAAQNRIHALLSGFVSLGQQGVAEVSCIRAPKTLKMTAAGRRVLAAMGVAVRNEEDAVCFDFGSAGLVEVWCWMSTRGDAGEISRGMTQDDVRRLFFAHCLFDSAYSYAGEIYRPLMGDSQAFDRLIAYLESHGYERTDNRAGYITLDYAKEYGKKESPLKDAWAERTHGGVSFQYDAQAAEPAFLSLRIPMVAELLRRLEEADAPLRRFILKMHPKCRGCRYCVQMDKTGKRPLASIPVEEDGETYRLCTMMPGFAYCWTRMDDDLVDQLIACLEWFDRCLA